MEEGQKEEISPWWPWLTPWLPNWRLLCKTFMAVTVTIAVGVLAGIVIPCYRCWNDLCWEMNYWDLSKRSRVPRKRGGFDGLHRKFLYPLRLLNRGGLG